jgi:hypothetical protein
VSKLNPDQFAFARAMTAKQWAMLRALSIGSFYLSAAERADPECYALIRQRLAICCTLIPGISALWMWEATPEGKLAIRKRDAGKL